MQKSASALDSPDSRTDGSAGTSTLDLELFFSIMHTEHPEFCTKLLLHLWEFDRGDRSTDGTAGTGTFDLDLLYNQKKCKYSTKTGNLHKSFPVKLTEEIVRPLLLSGLQAGWYPLIFLDREDLQKCQESKSSASLRIGHIFGLVLVKILCILSGC